MTQTPITRVLAAFAVAIVSVAGVASLDKLSARIDVQAEAQEDAAVTRVAQRLQQRVQRRFGKNVSLSAAEDAVRLRRTLLTRTVTVSFNEATMPPSGEPTPEPFVVSLQRFPAWLAFKNPAKPTFEVDAGVIAMELQRDESDGLPRPLHARVLGTEQRWGLAYATMTGSVRSGYRYDEDAVAEEIAGALADGTASIVADVTYEHATVVGLDGSPMELLSTGRSTFDTSPWGRKMNVHKAMNKHLHGRLIQPGETFSFNATLGGPVTKGNGWHDSLIIVNGRDLEPAPGGGICQAATTLYRAMVLAGLPIVARKPHSLYVHYYERFGLGLDATVFPKRQDLTFVNDTGDVMLIQAYTVGDEAVVNLFGRRDGRSVVMEGPYFASNAPAGLTVNGRGVRTNEIVWRQTVLKPTGDETRLIVSGYNNGVPRNLAAKYAEGKGIAELYTDVPLSE
jgi:vancomycin resistance protein YoaR